MLQSESDWLNAESLFIRQEAFESRIVSVNPGGVIVDFGQLKGFVPKSQLSPFHQLMFEESVSIDGQKELSMLGQFAAHRKTGRANFSWFGQSVSLRIIQIDRARNRIILSESTASTDPAKSA